jgi:hypothetical protein
MNKNYFELGEVAPYHFNKKLILALDERWLNFFESKNQNFKVAINQNQIILIGPKVSTQDPTESYNQPSEADTIG